MTNLCSRQQLGHEFLTPFVVDLGARFEVFESKLLAALRHQLLQLPSLDLPPALTEVLMDCSSIDVGLFRLFDLVLFAHFCTVGLGHSGQSTLTATHYIEE